MFFDKVDKCYDGADARLLTGGAAVLTGIFSLASSIFSGDCARDAAYHLGSQEKELVIVRG
jgi:hypothetical protein